MVCVGVCSILALLKGLPDANLIFYRHPPPLPLQALSVSLLLLGGEGDGLAQRGGEGGQADEVPVLPVPLRPRDVVPDGGAVRGRGGLPKVDHPDVGLAAVVVDKEERAADDLVGRVRRSCWFECS